MIRKKVTGTTERLEEGWRNLSQCAAFEVTSEEVGSPLENALTPDEKKWIAATPGEQIIRITFDEPQRHLEDLLVVRRDCDCTESRNRPFVATGRPAAMAGDCAATVQFQPTSDHHRKRKLQRLPPKSERSGALNNTRTKRRWTRLALTIANRITPSRFTTNGGSRGPGAPSPLQIRLPLSDTTCASNSARWSHEH